jgi:hypothetical protein
LADVRSSLLVVVLAASEASCGRFGFHDAQTNGDASAPPDAAFDPARCPASYTTVLPSSEHRYRIVLEWLPWDEARATCEQDLTSSSGTYTHLVVVGSEAERLELGAALSNTEAYDSYIGLTDLREEGVFRHVTLEPLGTFPLTTPPWAAGEPNNSGDNEHCVHFYGGSVLNDTVCTLLAPYTCECDGYPDTPSQY